MTSSGGFVNTHRFTGKEYENSGIYYFGARYYDPWLGRFLTPDPLGKFEPKDPKTINPYIYCSNNPLRYVDPDGRQALDVIDIVNVMTNLQILKWSAQQRVSHAFNTARNYGRKAPLPRDFLYSYEAKIVEPTLKNINAITRTGEPYIGLRFGLLENSVIKANISLEITNPGNLADPCNPVDMLNRKITFGGTLGFKNIGISGSVTIDPMSGISTKSAVNVSAGPIQTSSDGEISIEGELQPTPGIGVYGGIKADLRPESENDY
mgnify:CR=1 FL=1